MKILRVCDKRRLYIIKSSNVLKSEECFLTWSVLFIKLDKNVPNVSTFGLDSLNRSLILKAATSGNAIIVDPKKVQLSQ